MNEELIAVLSRLADAHEKIAAQLGRIADQMGRSPLESPTETGAEMIANALGNIASEIEQRPHLGRTELDS